MTFDRILIALVCAACSPVMAQAPAAPEPEPLGYYSGRVLSDGQMQVGRYTSAAATPAEEAAHPLNVHVRVSYPRQTVRTVGEALQHTLMRTGWRLVETSALAPESARLMNMPLPESQRALGPYRARTVLQVLTGPNWQWHEDPIRRVVWFQPTASGAVAVSAAPRDSARNGAAADTAGPAQPSGQAVATPAMPLSGAAASASVYVN